MSRDHILHRVRTALGRSPSQPIPDPPPARIRIPEVSLDARVASLIAQVEALAGTALETSDPRAYIASAIAGKTVIACNSPYLAALFAMVANGPRKCVPLSPARAAVLLLLICQRYLRCAHEMRSIS